MDTVNRKISAVGVNIGLGQIIGKNAKRCKELVEITAKELDMIHL